MEIFEGNNIASLKKVEVILQDDIESLNPLALKSGKSFLNVPLTPQKNNLTIATEDSENGTVYNHSGKFFLHRVREEIFTSLGNFVGRRSVLRLTDMNNVIYILGTKDNCVLLNFKANTGESYTAQNGVEFTFSVDMAFRAPAI
jgi:hypothetical protein